jgi:hypothetical protein
VVLIDYDKAFFACIYSFYFTFAKRKETIVRSVTTPKDVSDRLFGWWYRLAAPPDISEDAPLYERERVRRSKLASIIILFEVVYHFATIGVGVTSNPGLLPTLIIALIVLAVAAIFNRNGKTSVAGTLSVLILEVGMFANFTRLALAGGGLSSFDLPLYDILIIPTLIAISLFPGWVTFSVAALNSLLIVASIVLLPKTAELTQALAGAPYDTWFRPVSIQLVAALVCYFWVSNAFQAMKRADSAEEVNKLAQTLATQQQIALQEKQQLEESIQQIVEVHTQVANGNLRARVPLTQNNVLWSIAGSLNNLLARMQRWRQDAQQLQRLEQMIQQVVYDMRQAKKRGASLQMQKTGTILDPLIAEIAVEKGNYLVSSDRPVPAQELLTPQERFPPAQELFTPQERFPPAQELFTPQERFPSQADTFMPQSEGSNSFRKRPESGT